MNGTGPYPASLLLLAGLMVWSCTREASPSVARDSENPPLIILERKEIEEIFLHLPRENVRLRREGGFWFLPDWNNHPADRVYVDVLLNALTGLSPGERVTIDPDEYSRYGLGAETKTISLRDGRGRELTALQVGKYGKHYREAYIKLPDQAQVYLAQTDLFPALSRVTWADRTVWRMLPEVIEEVFVTGFPRDFHAKRTARQTWESLLPGSHELDGSFAMGVLPRLAFLRAGNIEFEPRPERRFITERTINIVVASTTLRLELGHVNQEVILARRGTDPVIFKFSRALLQMIESAVSEP